jgi:hypothetical protein
LTFSRSVTESETLAYLERVVHAAIGVSGFMEIARFDLGEYLRRQFTEDCIKTNSEKLSELKVRVYGNTAVATYKDTYDILIKGEHRAHTIIATDTFVKVGSEWKQAASHGSEAK